MLALLLGATVAYGAIVTSGYITNAPGEQPFRLLLTSYDGEDSVVVARPTHYEYAPAPVQLGPSTIGMWFCGGGGTGALGGDSVFYAESTDYGRTGTWSAPIEVVRPSTNDAYLDHGHACDPSVAQYNGYWYVLYTGTADWRLNPSVPQCAAPVGCDNRIFAARVPADAAKDPSRYEKLVNVGDCLDPACFQWKPFWSGTEHPPVPVVRHETAPVWRRQGSGPAGGTIPYTTAYGIGQSSHLVNAGTVRIWSTHVSPSSATTELWTRPASDLADAFRFQDSATFTKKLSNAGNDVNYDVAFAAGLDRYVVDIARDDLSDPSGRPCVHASQYTGADTGSMTAPIMSMNLADQPACFLPADPSAHNSGLLRDPFGTLVEQPGHAGGPAYSWVYFGTDLDKIATDAGKFDIKRTPFTLQPPPPPGTLFTPVTPARVLDTRDGTGAPAAGKLGGAQTLTLQVGGRGGVPAGATSVLLNVTVTEPDVEGYVTAFPCDATRPLASNLNFVAGQTVPNLVSVRLDGQGRACLFASGSTHLVADTAGYFSATGARFTAVAPSRLLDTREGVGGAPGRLAVGQTLPLQVTGRGGVPAGATSAFLNVTVTDPEGPGFVTVFPCDASRPLASNLNYVRGQTVPNLVAVRLDAQGQACLFASNATHLVADVGGYTSSVAANSGPAFSAVSPSRLLDTRDGAGKVGANGTTVLSVAGHGGVPVGATAAVLNVTVTEPEGDGYVTVYPCDAPRPLASNLNYVAGQTVPNLVAVRLDAQGSACLFSLAPTHLVADVAGYFAAS